MQLDEESIKIIAVLKQIYGRDLSVYDETFLQKSIGRRCLEIGAPNTAEYTQCLEKDPREAENLWYSLQISFSQFFRDSVTFAVLEQSIFPDIIANKCNGSEIRIWSAGCANGQEAYSIAILLSDIANTCGKEIHFRIFATDISQEALSFGSAGVYDKNMILEVKTKYLNKYFNKQGKYYTIVPELRQRINFSIYDLLDLSMANPPESIYGGFDIVLCSNVLIYYKKEIQLYVIKKLLQAVSPMGYLVTGESEKILVKDTTKMDMVYTLAPVFQNTKVK